MTPFAPRRPRTRLVLAVLIPFCINLISQPTASVAQRATGIPAVWIIGFSLNSYPPGYFLPFRLALSYSINRDAIARAALLAGCSDGGFCRPAGNIQHPSVRGYDPGVRSHSYDAAKAKDLFGQIRWTSPINILTASSPVPWVIAGEKALADSVRDSIGATVTFAKVANFDVLTRSTRSGMVPIWLYGWSANPRDFGYPSMAMGIAHEYYMSDQEVRALVERGAAQELEQMLLDKALVIPIIFFVDK